MVYQGLTRRAGPEARRDAAESFDDILAQISRAKTTVELPAPSTPPRSTKRPCSAPKPGSRASSRSTQTGSTGRNSTPSTRESSESGRDFFRHVPSGRCFTPRVEYLEPKMVGNGSAWDEQRMLLPERAFPCISGGAADFHDHNKEREAKPAWKPTICNRGPGMGCQLGPAFPMPPRSSSSSRAKPRTPRPPSAPRTPQERQVFGAMVLAS